MKGYKVGTEVQAKNGVVRKKVGEREWISRGRYIFGKEHGVKLSSDQRVFHIDGDRENDEPSNLVAILFGGPTYQLVRSRVVFRPH